MNNYNNIKRAISNLNIEVNDNPSKYKGVNKLTGTNMITALQRHIKLLINKNTQLNRRLEVAKAKINMMYMEFMKTSKKSRIEFLNENTLREKYMRLITSLKSTPSTRNNSSSFVDVKAGRSEMGYRALPRVGLSRRFCEMSMSKSASGRSPSPSLCHAPATNLFSTYTVACDRALVQEQLRSCAAGLHPQVERLGHCVGLHAHGRDEVLKRNAHMLMVDKARMAKVYTDIRSVLYKTMMTKQLPPVSSSLTKRLLMSMPRTSKTDMLMSEAATWSEMEMTQEGRDIMAILKIMIVSAKRVPEAMVHPVLQLIPYIHMLLVQVHNGEAIFTIDL